jgi:hypothetical protein
LDVGIAPDTEPREVALPDDFTTALKTVESMGFVLMEAGVAVTR